MSRQLSDLFGTALVEEFDNLWKELLLKVDIGHVSFAESIRG